MGKKKQRIPDEKIDYITKATPRTMAGQIPVFCSFDKLASPIELVGNPHNPKQEKLSSAHKRIDENDEITKGEYTSWHRMWSRWRCR